MRARVLVVDEPQTMQRQPGFVHVDYRARVDDDGRQPARRDDPGVATELLHHAFDDAVDLPGEAVDDARLQRLHGALADDRPRLRELDLAQLRAVLGERLDRDGDAGRDGPTEVLALLGDRVE